MIHILEQPADAAEVGFMSSKEEIDASIRRVEENGGNFLTNYIKPWINIAALNVFKWAADSVKNLEKSEY